MLAMMSVRSSVVVAKDYCHIHHKNKPNYNYDKHVEDVLRLKAVGTMEIKYVVGLASCRSLILITLGV